MTFQKGNKKILENDKYLMYCWSIAPTPLVEKLGVNLPKTCTNCEQCKSICYDRKAWRYPSVVASRVNNLKETMKEDFNENLVAEILKLEREALKLEKQLVIRMHVAGDFYSKEYLKTWIRTMRWFNSVKFYAYTKNYNLFDGIELPKNFSLLYSMVDGMEKEIQEKIINSDKDIFLATNNEVIMKKGTKVSCKGSDCANCGICINKGTRKLIVCKIH